MTMLQVIFFINWCWLIEAGYLHMQAIFGKINQVARQLATGVSITINPSLVQVIVTHIKIVRCVFRFKCVVMANLLCAYCVIRLANQLADVLSGPLFFELLRSIIMSSSSLLMMENV